MNIDISAEPATPPETGVKVHVRKGAEMVKPICLNCETEMENYCNCCGWICPKCGVKLSNTGYDLLMEGKLVGVPIKIPTLDKEAD